MTIRINGEWRGFEGLEGRLLISVDQAIYKVMDIEACLEVDGIVDAFLVTPGRSTGSRAVPSKLTLELARYG